MIELNVECVYNYLITIANKQRNTITYAEMEKFCGMVHNQQNVQKLIKILNHTMMYNKMRNEPLIATLVVNKETERPGKGYYKTLKELDIEASDEVEFFVKEIQRIRNYKWEKWKGI